MSEGKTRVNVRSTNHKLADRIVDLLVETVRQLGFRVAGPIPLPTAVLGHTVLRGCGKPRERVESRIHRRMFVVLQATPDVVATISRLNIPASVDVSFEDRPAT